MWRVCRRARVRALAFGAAALVGCGGAEQAPELGKLSGQLSAAATAMGEAIPDLGNAYGGAPAPKRKHPRVLVPLYRADWASTNPVHRVDPPGGVAQPGETYGGVALGQVNYRDYMKMVLDPTFSRVGDVGTYRPGLYGRMDGTIQLFTYVEQSGIPVDAAGLPEVGSHSVPFTVNGQALRVLADVAATSHTAWYDRRMELRGFLDSNGNGALDAGEQLAFHNLAWMRATAGQLNVMVLELRDHTQDTVPDVFSVHVLNWNRSTGNLRFEGFTLPDDATDLPLESHRLLIEQSGGKAWLHGFSGSPVPGANGAQYFQYVLYSPSSTAAEGTFSLRRLSGTDTYFGNICGVFNTGAGEDGVDVNGQVPAAGGGTCQGQAADAIQHQASVVAPSEELLTATRWVAGADSKGFPASAHPDWSSPARLSAWLSAGEAITVSFADKAQFISRLDPAPP
jgi:hypothetical protein